MPIQQVDHEGQTRRIMRTICETVHARLGFELEIGDAIIESIEQLQTGVYACLDYLGESPTDMGIGTGETEVRQVYGLTLGCRARASGNAMLDLYDCIDTIVDWLKYQRFGNDDVSPSGAREVAVGRREEFQSPNVYGIQFYLDVIKEASPERVPQPDSHTELILGTKRVGHPVESIHLSINDSQSMEIWRRESDG